MTFMSFDLADAYNCLGIQEEFQKFFGFNLRGRLFEMTALGKFIIAHVEGGSAAQNSSMTSSLTGVKPGGEGRDEELTVAFCFECDWTMNSWVFRQYLSCLQSQSITRSTST